MGFEDLDDDAADGGSSGGPGLAAWIIPLVSVAGALVVGLVGGGLISWLIFGRAPEVVEVARQLSNEELEALCSPLVDDAVEEAADDLSQAQERVATLQDDVFAKEREVAELELEMARRAERGAALVAELEAARAELTSLKAELSAAVEEKERLFVALRHTEEALVEQRVETYVAREDALAFKWATFLGSGQLEICEKGGRRRMGQCREKVETSLPAFRTRFEHCIRSGQEIPTFVEAPRDLVDLPAYAEWIDQEDRVTRGWYVLLCDPTLPESEEFAAPPLPQREGTTTGELDLE